MKKKILTGLLSIVLCISYSIPAFAGTLTIGDAPQTADVPSSFTVTSDDIDLGTEGLTVKIPARMDLTYDSTNKVFTNTDKVSAEGYLADGKKLEISTSSDITYLPATYESDTDYVLENSVKANGTITFGTSNKEVWTPTEVSSSDERGISVSVPEEEVIVYDVYTSTITFNIAVVDE